MATSTFPCPHCGQEVSRKATFCRHCGASEDSGWDEETTAHLAGGYEDDEDDFDYDDYVRREFPDDSDVNVTMSGQQIVAAILLAIFLLVILMQLA